MRIFILVYLTCIAAHGQWEAKNGIAYHKADSIAAIHRGMSLDNLPLLAYRLTKDLPTDHGKFRAIFTWVSTNIANDYDAFTKTKHRRQKLRKEPLAFEQWNRKYLPTMFKNLLKKKKTACTGYAYLIRELSSLSGLDCRIVDGYGRTAHTALNETSVANHSWNAIELDGNWYLCDATWSAGSIRFEKEAISFKPDFNDSYFLPDPKLFIKNHYPIDPQWALLEEPPSFKTFITGPIIYRSAFENRLNPTYPATMDVALKVNQPLEFTIQQLDNQADRPMRFVINKNGKTSKIDPIQYRSGDTIHLRHSFKRRGHYDLHIFSGDQAISTYVVEVVR